MLDFGRYFVEGEYLGGNPCVCLRECPVCGVFGEIFPGMGNFSHGLIFSLRKRLEDCVSGMFRGNLIITLYRKY